MIRRFALISVSTLLLTSSVASAAAEPDGARHAALTACGSGARTLSHPGDHVYPDMGNAGYVSLHTDVHLVYDAPANRFLPGHRLRLDVTSSDFPNYDRNHNTAADPNADAELRPAAQTVHFGGARASKLMLPVTRK